MWMVFLFIIIFLILVVTYFWFGKDLLDDEEQRSMNEFYAGMENYYDK